MIDTYATRPETEQERRAREEVYSGNGLANFLPLRILNLCEFMSLKIRPRERILAPWLLTQSLNMLYAWRGVGKTHVALGISYAVASGGGFLGWDADRPRRVLYLDGEMPAVAMQERIKGLVLASEKDFNPDNLRILTPDLQTGFMPDLTRDEGQDAISGIVADAELIVIDNLSTLAYSGGRENDAESWLSVQEWALRMRREGRSVLFVHHSAKGGQQRGTSKREDVLDCVISLRRPPDYQPDQGAVFELHFEKSREAHGESVQPFEARLTTDAHGASVWTTRKIEDGTLERVIALASDGLTQKEIAEELGIHKSNVSRTWRKAVSKGLIKPDD